MPRTARSHVVLPIALSLSALFATGCPDAPSCAECAPIAFDVEIMGDGGSSVPLADGASVPWVWGFQGGTMVQPRLVFDPADVRIGDTMLVVLRHSPDPAAPDAFGQASDFPELRLTLQVLPDDAGRPVIGPIADQLGWTELDGIRLTYDVEISSPTIGTSSKSAVIELATMMGPGAECDAFPTLETGCSYRLVVGTATVVTIEAPPSSDYNCTDASRVTLSFVPDDPDGANACAAALGSVAVPLPAEHRFTVGAGANPPASCLDGAGISMGATLPATLQVIERGTCSPVFLQLDVDTSACDAMCS